MRDERLVVDVSFDDKGGYVASPTRVEERLIEEARWCAISARPLSQPGPYFPYLTVLPNKVLAPETSIFTYFIGIIWWAHQDSNLGPADKELANHLEVGVAFSAKLAVFVSVGKR
jgi:hypothetical protein